jgi:hypothetical protein
MGPKISSWAIFISSVTPRTTVGARVCGRREASPGRCPTSMIRAPWLRASSIRSVTVAYCWSLTIEV